MKTDLKTVCLTEHQTIEEKLTPEEAHLLRQYFSDKLDIQYTSSPGKFRITAKSFVGNIALKKHIIYIKPKVNLLNFSYMLSTVIEIIDFRKHDLSYQKENENIVFELIVSDLLKRVEDLCRKGISKKYYDTEENLSYVKGKILVKENLRYNLVYRNKIYCRYSDFGPDTIENRIIKYTLHHLSRIQFTNPDLYRKVKRLLHYFEPVSLISYSKFPTILFDKLTFHYQTIITLCELIISNSSLYVEKRDLVKFSSFLVDMDKLFEKFVFRLLESNLKKKGFHVKNDSNRYIDEELRTSIKPDIVVKKKGIIILILDTKYKTSIKNDDLNQMWIYCISSNISTGILVYPQYSEEQIPPSRTLLMNKCRILLKNINLAGNSFEEFNTICKAFVNDVEKCIKELPVLITVIEANGDKRLKVA